DLKMFCKAPAEKISSKFANLDPKANTIRAGLESRELPPLNGEQIKRVMKGCAWLKTALKTGGKNYSQPEWNLTTLCATFMENGEKFAHGMGNKHPGYSHDSTEALWARKNREREASNLGWPSCRAIRDAGSRDCEACPHFDRGKSPLNLAI